MPGNEWSRTARKTSYGGPWVASELIALDSALSMADGIAARTLLMDLLRSEVRDDVLALLAGRAGREGLALELLIEAVDELGLARHAVRRVLVDAADVEDAAQDTLIAIAAGVGSFRGDAKFTTWLHQIARNRAIDVLRRKRATGSLDEHDVGDAQRMSSVIASREHARQLVNRLPERYREAVLLRDIERASYAEAAERLGRNVNTVKAHVARGRALLARMLDDGGAV
jgi:RNA polymerase sigma-70 factor, ECF subfamily